jgi:hypothetical protein
MSTFRAGNERAKSVQIHKSLGCPDKYAGRFRISVTFPQAVSAGAGRFGAMLWVKAEEVEMAGKALRASII